MFWSACSSRSGRRGGSRSCDHCAPNPNIRPFSRKALAQRKRRRWRKLADQRHRWIGRTTASAGRLKSCATNASSEGDVYGPIGSVLDVTGVLIRAVRLINRRWCAARTHVDRARRSAINMTTNKITRMPITRTRSTHIAASSIPPACERQRSVGMPLLPLLDQYR